MIAIETLAAGVKPSSDRRGGLKDAMKSSPAQPWRGVRLVGFSAQAVSLRGDALPEHRVVLQMRGDAEIEWQPNRNTEPLKTVRRVGEISIFPAQMPLWLKSKCLGSVFEVMLEPGFFKTAAQGVRGNQPAELGSAINVTDSLVSALVLGLITESEAGCLGGRAYGEAIGATLSAHLAHYYGPKGEISNGNGQGLTNYQLRLVNDYINNRLPSNISLRDLAAVVRLSPFHFARLFKLSTGVAPHQHLVRLRVEQARNLLAEGSTPILDIARQVGFSDQSHLALHFKRVYGTTPRAFRNSATGGGLGSPSDESRNSPTGLPTPDDLQEAA